jgi:hypothetical protein
MNLNSHLCIRYMPSKHNSLPSILYLVIILQCFDPLLGHHQAYIKTRKCITFYILRAILIYRSYQYTTEWTQTILISIPMFTCPGLCMYLPMTLVSRFPYLKNYITVSLKIWLNALSSALLPPPPTFSKCLCYTSLYHMLLICSSTFKLHTFIQLSSYTWSWIAIDKAARTLN